MEEFMKSNLNFSSRVANLNPYIPGEQPKDREYIKLNANENPYPPSPNVVEELSHFIKNNEMKIGLYPDPDSTELRKSIAEHINKTGGCMNNPQKLKNPVSENMIFCGNGSDEVLSFVFFTFFDKVIIPEHTYSFYPVYCDYYGIKLEKIPLNSDFTLNKKLMLEKSKESSGLIFANPNAPTSLTLSNDEIRTMIKNYPKDKVFVVDEAYADFSNDSAIPLLEEFDNLVIVRTFSKSMCGAGMRLGYLVASEKIISVIKTAKNSFNHFPVDSLTQCFGINSCKNTDYYIECTKKIVNSRQDFCEFLKNNNWFFYESSTNFVLAKKDGLQGKQIYEAIKKEGVLVRHFSTKGIEDFVRISIGTECQMEKLKQIMSTL